MLTMTKHTSLRFLGAASLAVLLSACISGRSSLSRVSESDLVGVWRADYSQSVAHVDASGVETVTLRADHTYQQTFHNGSGYAYESARNNWYMDQDKLIHLEGGLWFPLGVDEALQAQKGRVDSIMIHGKSVTVSLADEIILVVADHNGQIALEHLPIAELDVPGIVSFAKLSLLPTNSP